MGVWWSSRPGCFTPEEGPPVLIVDETGWTGLDGCGKYAVGYRVVKCRDAKLISAMSQKSAVTQLHRSDTLGNSHLAMLVCPYVHSADETGSVTRG